MQVILRSDTEHSKNFQRIPTHILKNYLVEVSPVPGIHLKSTEILSYAKNKLKPDKSLAEQLSLMI